MLDIINSDIFLFNTFINEKEGYKDETSMEDTKVTQQRIKTNLTKKKERLSKKYALTITDNTWQYKIGTDPLWSHYQQWISTFNTFTGVELHTPVQKIMKHKKNLVSLKSKGWPRERFWDCSENDKSRNEGRNKLSLDASIQYTLYIWEGSSTMH